MIFDILKAVFGALFSGIIDGALKLIELLQKKPEDIVREKGEKKNEEIIHNAASVEPDKPYNVLHNDNSWGKGKDS